MILGRQHFQVPMPSIWSLTHRPAESKSSAALDHAITKNPALKSIRKRYLPGPLQCAALPIEVSPLKMARRCAYRIEWPALFAGRTHRYHRPSAHCRLAFSLANRGSAFVERDDTSLPILCPITPAADRTEPFPRRHFRLNHPDAIASGPTPRRGCFKKELGRSLEPDLKRLPISPLPGTFERK